MWDARAARYLAGMEAHCVPCLSRTLSQHLCALFSSAVLDVSESLWGSRTTHRVGTQGEMRVDSGRRMKHTRSAISLLPSVLFFVLLTTAPRLVRSQTACTAFAPPHSLPLEGAVSSSCYSCWQHVRPDCVYCAFEGICQEPGTVCPDSTSTGWGYCSQTGGVIDHRADLVSVTLTDRNASLYQLQARTIIPNTTSAAQGTVEDTPMNIDVQLSCSVNIIDICVVPKIQGQRISVSVLSSASPVSASVTRVTNSETAALACAKPQIGWAFRATVGYNQSYTNETRSRPAAQFDITVKSADGYTRTIAHQLRTQLPSRQYCRDSATRGGNGPVSPVPSDPSGGNGVDVDSGVSSTLIIAVVSLCIVLAVLVLVCGGLYLRHRHQHHQLRSSLQRKQPPATIRWKGYKGGAVQVVVNDDEDLMPGVSREKWNAELMHALGSVNTGIIVDFQAIEMGDKIASGGGGAVYVANWRNMEVVVKEPFWFAGTRSEDLINEITMLASLSHPNIVQFFGVSHNDRRVYIVTEYCPLGSLNDWLLSNRLDLDTFCAIGLDLCATLHWLHVQGIVHRDIKPHNILMNTTTSIKICDLGTCRSQADGGASMTANVGTASYTPPEVMSSRRAVYDGRKWDVYSASLVLYFMWTGEKPFGNKGNYEIIMGVANGNGLRPEYPYEGMPHPLWELLTSMWHEDPEQRPLCNACLSTLSSLELAYTPDVNVDESGGKNSLHAASAEIELAVQNEAQHDAAAPMDPPEAWEVYQDETSGAEYYFNAQSRRTTWSRPAALSPAAGGNSASMMHNPYYQSAQ